MPFTPLKMVIAAVWLLVVVAIASLTPITTLTGWVTAMGIGVIPSVLMLRAWRQPGQTLSESIQTQIRS